MTARTRHTIDDMAYFLVSEVAELGNDTACVMALIGRGFRSTEIFDNLDVARDIARDARATEADLWDRLMKDPHA